MSAGKRFDSFKPGDRVKFTGTFLRSTGQIVGGEGNKVWTVRDCSCSSCKSGSLVCTDESYDEAHLKRFYTAEEIATLPHLRWRHIASGNLMPQHPKALRAGYFPS